MQQKELIEMYKSLIRIIEHKGLRKEFNLDLNLDYGDKFVKSLEQK